LFFYLFDISCNIGHLSLLIIHTSLDISTASYLEAFRITSLYIV